MSRRDVKVPATWHRERPGSASQGPGRTQNRELASEASLLLEPSGFTSGSNFQSAERPSSGLQGRPRSAKAEPLTASQLELRRLQNDLKATSAKLDFSLYATTHTQPPHVAADTLTPPGWAPEKGLYRAPEKMSAGDLSLTYEQARTAAQAHAAREQRRSGAAGAALSSMPRGAAFPQLQLHKLGTTWLSAGEEEGAPTTARRTRDKYKQLAAHLAAIGEAGGGSDVMGTVGGNLLDDMVREVQGATVLLQNATLSGDGDAAAQARASLTDIAVFLGERETDFIKQKTMLRLLEDRCIDLIADKRNRAGFMQQQIAYVDAELQKLRNKPGFRLADMTAAPTEPSDLMDVGETSMAAHYGSVTRGREQSWLAELPDAMGSLRLDGTADRPDWGSASLGRPGSAAPAAEGAGSAVVPPGGASGGPPGLSDLAKQVQQRIPLHDSAVSAVPHTGSATGTPRIAPLEEQQDGEPALADSRPAGLVRNLSGMAPEQMPRVTAKLAVAKWLVAEPGTGNRLKDIKWQEGQSDGTDAALLRTKSATGVAFMSEASSRRRTLDAEVLQQAGAGGGLSASPSAVFLANAGSSRRLTGSRSLRRQLAHQDSELAASSYSVWGLSETPTLPRQPSTLLSLRRMPLLPAPGGQGAEAGQDGGLALAWSHRHIGPGHMPELVHELQGGRPYTTLALAGNKLTDECVAELVQMLGEATHPKMSSVTGLDLSHNSLLTWRCTQSLGAVLGLEPIGDAPSQPAEVWLPSVQSEAAELRGGLYAKAVQCVSLRHLDLSSVAIGDRGAQVLAQALTLYACKLHTLLLSRCGITDAGGALLLQALVEDGSLLNLDLSWNQLGRQTAAAAQALLEITRTLNNLELGHNKLTDADGASILDGLLRSSGCVRYLGLSGNGLQAGATLVAAAVLRRACADAHGIRTDDMPRSGSWRGLVSLGGAELPLLIDLSGNPLGASGLRLLMDAMARVVVQLPLALNGQGQDASWPCDIYTGMCTFALHEAQVAFAAQPPAEQARPPAYKSLHQATQAALAAELARLAAAAAPPPKKVKGEAAEAEAAKKGKKAKKKGGQKKKRADGGFIRPWPLDAKIDATAASLDLDAPGGEYQLDLSHAASHHLMERLLEMQEEQAAAAASAAAAVADALAAKAAQASASSVPKPLPTQTAKAAAARPSTAKKGPPPPPKPVVGLIVSGATLQPSKSEKDVPLPELVAQLRDGKKQAATASFRVAAQPALFQPLALANQPLAEPLMGWLVDALTHPSANDKWRLSMLGAIVPQRLFSADQMLQVLDTFATSVGYGDFSDFGTAALLLLPRLVQPLEMWTKALPALSTEYARAARAALAHVSPLSAHNLTGRYVLNLSCAPERLLAQRLQQEALAENSPATVHKHCTNWRNATLHGEPLAAAALACVQDYLIPDTGILELDYVSHRPPPEGATSASREDLFGLLVRMDAAQQAYLRRVMELRTQWLPGGLTGAEVAEKAAVEAKRQEIYAEEERRARRRKGVVRPPSGTQASASAAADGTEPGALRVSALDAIAPREKSPALVAEASRRGARAAHVWRFGLPPPDSGEETGAPWWHGPSGGAWAGPLFAKVEAAERAVLLAKAGHGMRSGSKRSAQAKKAPKPGKPGKGKGAAPPTHAELIAVRLLRLSRLSECVPTCSFLTRAMVGQVLHVLLSQGAAGDKQGHQAAVKLLQAMPPVAAVWYIFRMRDLNQPPLDAESRKALFAAMGPKLQRCYSQVAAALNAASAQRTAEMQLQLRALSERHTVTAAQVARVLQVLKNEPERVQAVLILWQAVVDKPAMRPVLEDMAPPLQQEVFARLGYWNVYTGLCCRPEGLQFRLHMGSPEQAQLAEELVRRATTTKGGAQNKAGKRPPSPAKARPGTSKGRPSTAKGGKEAKGEEKPPKVIPPPRVLRQLRVNGKVWSGQEDPDMWAQLQEAKPQLKTLEFEYAPIAEEVLARKGAKAKARIWDSWARFLHNRSLREAEAADAALDAALANVDAEAADATRGGALLTDEESPSAAGGGTTTGISDAGPADEDDDDVSSVGSGVL